MVLQTLKALADPSRLRIVDVLQHGELTVQELTAILGMGQSRVSRHLKILAGVGILAVKRQGTWAYYRLAETPFFSEIRLALQKNLQTLPAHRADHDRLTSILETRRQRSQQFFEQHARQWDRLAREVLPAADYRAPLLTAIPGCRGLLEVGVGTGVLLAALREKAEKVIGVDYSPAMLEQARGRIDAEGLTGIDLRLGEMTHLPLSDVAVDAAILNMVLHHAAQPASVLVEIARVLSVDGALVIADLLRHDREWVRERMADQWLGFEQEELLAWLASAGFSAESFQIVSGRQEQLSVFILSARKR
ncbi:MAG: metalloregulator ArsR/SmtB family transcription factor [Desulfuromonadales bacterium]